MERRGFTLVELLVVIAIIAILAAILFPVFARTKEKAREGACKSSMRQIASAIQLYVDDWSNCFADQTSVGIPYRAGIYRNEWGGEWKREFAHRRTTTDGRPYGIAKALFPYVRNLGVFRCPGRAPLRQSTVRFASRVTLLYEEAWHSNLENPVLWGKLDSANIGTSKPVNAIFIDCHVGRIDVPYFPASGYDGNWYFFDKDCVVGKDGKLVPNTTTRQVYDVVNAGARDVP